MTSMYLAFSRAGRKLHVVHVEFRIFFEYISLCFIRWDEFWGHLWFGFGLMIYVSFIKHRAKSSAGGKEKRMWGCIVFDTTLEFPPNRKTSVIESVIS